MVLHWVVFLAVSPCDLVATVFLDLRIGLL